MAELIAPPAAPAARAAREQLRILHVTTRFTRGGAERNMSHVMSWERDQGHEVHLVMGRDSNPELAPPGIEVHVLDTLRRSVRPWVDVRAARALRRLIREHGFHVVHTHESKAGAVGRLAARRDTGAIVHTVHMPSFGAGYSRAQTPLFAAVERMCGRFTDIFLSVGEEIKELYLDRAIGIGKPFLTIRSPVDMSSFVALRHRDNGARTHDRQALGLHPDRRTIVTMGRLEPRKRPQLVLRELAPILEAENAQLVFAGEGPEYEAMLAATRELGVEERVTLLGHTNDPVAVIGCADVLVHGSLVEGVPQVVLQALAAGVPVVATEVEGLREVPDAPVTAVDRSGAGLAEAVSEQFRNGSREPVDLAHFAQWTTTRIDSTLEDFHSVLSRTLARPGGGEQGRLADRPVLKRSRT
jgi:glycosyltransferase involved in cell wall biosynthesis